MAIALSLWGSCEGGQLALLRGLATRRAFLLLGQPAPKPGMGQGTEGGHGRKDSALCSREGGELHAEAFTAKDVPLGTGGGRLLQNHQARGAGGSVLAVLQQVWVDLRSCHRERLLVGRRKELNKPAKSVSCQPADPFLVKQQISKILKSVSCRILLVCSTFLGAKKHPAGERT